MEDYTMPKSKFLMKVTFLKEDEEGNLKVTKSKWIQGNGREFRKDVYSDRAAGMKREIQIVDSAPTKFTINQIYMLRTRDRVWVYVKE